MAATAAAEGLAAGAGVAALALAVGEAVDVPVGGVDVVDVDEGVDTGTIGTVATGDAALTLVARTTTGTAVFEFEPDETLHAASISVSSRAGSSLAPDLCALGAASSTNRKPRLRIVIVGFSSVASRRSPAWYVCGNNQRQQ
jgi:hypothetical protein